MSNPRQHRFRYVAFGMVSTGLLFVGPAMAWADDSITLDFVRHGESVDNAAGIIDTAPPGTDLTETGQQEANAVAQAIYAEYGTNIAAIYASEEVRTQETAAPLADLLMNHHVPILSDNVQILSGLNEIDAGIFNGYPTDSLEGILYLLAPVAWVLGFDFVPELGDPSLNGITFDETFGGAVQTIYDETVNPAGNPIDVAFSSEGAIAVWTLMNVNNPDFSVILQQLLDTGQFLPNTGQVVVEGDPGDWTLVSYDGTPVPQDPGLPTELFVDLRDLIEAPQFAGYNIYEALLTDNYTTIENAIQAGISQVDTAIAQLPVAVFDDIVNAFSTGIPDLGSELSTAATDVAGLLPGDLNAMVAEALASL